LSCSSLISNKLLIINIETAVDSLSDTEPTLRLSEPEKILAIFRSLFSIVDHLYALLETFSYV
jgi:hypothetical protein